MSSEERRRFGPPVEAGSAQDDAVTLDDTLSWSTEPVMAEPVPADDEDAPQVGWLASLLGLKRRERLEARIRQLDKAAAAAPDAPVNYVLRGEIKLKLGRRDEAATDFQQALGLTERAFAESDWGLVAQALADRALAGLRRSGYAVRAD